MSARHEPETDAPSVSAGLERIGVGLFTIPRMLDQDVATAMEKLADVGDKKVEFFGPSPYSVPEGHETWEAAAESLPFENE